MSSFLTEDGCDDIYDPIYYTQCYLNPFLNLFTVAEHTFIISKLHKLVILSLLSEKNVAIVENRNHLEIMSEKEKNHHFIFIIFFEKL